MNSIRPAELYWGVLVSLFLIGGIAAGVCWVVWLIMSYKSQRRTEAYQEATLAHAKEAAERSLIVTVKLDEVAEMRRQVVEVKEHIQEVLPLLPPRTNHTAWYIAPFIAASIAVSSWAVIQSEGDRMAHAHKSDGNLIATKAYQSMRMGVRDYKSALSLFAEAESNGADTVLVLDGMIQCHVNLNEYAKAEERLGQLEALSRGRVKSLTLRGYMLQHQGRAIEAMTPLHEAARNGDIDAAAMMTKLVHNYSMTNVRGDGAGSIGKR